MTAGHIMLSNLYEQMTNQLYIEVIFQKKKIYTTFHLLLRPMIYLLEKKTSNPNPPKSKTQIDLISHDVILNPLPPCRHTAAQHCFPTIPSVI